MKATAFLEARPAELEVILAAPNQSFRWYEHDYPYALARWNHHPEYEIHLIRQGSGRLLAGDYVGPFAAGHVAMIGPDLPHDWIGDLPPGEVLAGRDVVIQFNGERLRSRRRWAIIGRCWSRPAAAWNSAATRPGRPLP